MNWQPLQANYVRHLRFPPYFYPAQILPSIFQQGITRHLIRSLIFNLLEYVQLGLTG